MEGLEQRVEGTGVGSSFQGVSWWCSGSEVYDGNGQDRWLLNVFGTGWAPQVEPETGIQDPVRKGWALRRERPASAGGCGLRWRPAAA